MMRKIFLSVFGSVFVLLLLVQGYFAFNDDAVRNMQAKRLGAEYISVEEITAEAAENMGGMTVYLTIETEENRPSEGILTINGIEAGNFAKGILTVALREGDIPAVKNAMGETFFITDYPESISRDALPERLYCDETVTKWGKISFQ